jgi:murein DD-endopeptidase MepM/ murein hydrolase activator NlpD
VAPRGGAPWRWPLAGRPPVLRPFDPPAKLYGPGHRGADLGAAAGDPVLAAGPGVVSFAGVLAGRGVVAVRHPGGLRTTYEPLVVTVRVGAVVPPGGVLGRMAAGHAGCPWPACLHWGLLRGEDYLDPLSLLRHGPVRLLPLDTAAPGGATLPLPGAGGPVDGGSPLAPGPVTAGLAAAVTAAVVARRRRPP